MQQTQNLQGLALLVVKYHLPIQFVENIWLKCFVMHLCPKIVFPLKKTFSQEILVDLVEKMKQEYMLPKLKQCYSVITSFDLWMSKGAHDVFTLVINFLNEKWQPKHVTIGLFEANETIGQAMARNLTELLNKYDLRKKNVAYVKDEGANLNARKIILKFVVNCEVLGMEENFQGTFFGHAFSKACQYGKAKKKVCKNLKHISIKLAQSNLQKCITWPKKFRKGRYEWTKACIDSKIRPRKLNTPVKRRFIF